MKPNVEMPSICSLTNSPLQPYLTLEDCFLTHEKFVLYKNEEESLLTTLPVPENLSAYYESKEYISHQTDSKGLVPKLYSWAQRISLRAKRRLIQIHSPNSNTLLDYGSGAGVFLKFMGSSGWSASGVEPNDSVRRISVQKTGLQVSSLDEFKGLSQEYSVITLWHVLEHIPNYNEIVSDIRGRLSDNGILIMAVPNFKSWDAKHYRSYWAAYDVPRHLYHWSKEGIELLAKKHGMKVIRTRGMWFDAFYVSILSEKYKDARLPFIKGVCMGLWSNLNAIFTGETSSLIYVLKKAQ